MVIVPAGLISGATLSHAGLPLKQALLPLTANAAKLTQKAVQAPCRIISALFSGTTHASVSTMMPARGPCMPLWVKPDSI